jgi:hypothetical protein
MKLKPNAGRDYEIPSEDNHRAAIVALVDLGTQEEEYQGRQERKRKILLVWELLDETRSDGRPHLLARAYTCSLNEKAALRGVCEAAKGKIHNDVEVDLTELLGLPVMLNVVHGEGKEGKVYAKIEGVAPASKLERGKRQETQTEPYLFSMFEGSQVLNALPDWLPYLYGKKIVDVLALSPEYQSLPKQQPPKTTIPPRQSAATAGKPTQQPAPAPDLGEDDVAF